MDNDQEDICGLNDLLDRVEETAEQEREVSLGTIVDMVGRRWFAPLLLVAGLVIAAPGVGDIPGVPVIIGLLVLLISVQAFMDKRQVWLPDWLRKRSVSPSKIRKSVRFLRKPAGWADKVTRPRQKWAVRHAGAHVIAITCIIIAAATPVLEFIPFSGTVAGTAIAAFGLALLAHDGLIAIAAILFSLGTFGLVVIPFL